MITFSTQAEIALRSLHPQDRDRVVKSIEMLDRFPKDEHLREKVKKLGGFADLYLMRVTPKLRVIFRSTDENREVVDIVTHDRLKRMHPYAP